MCVRARTYYQRPPSVLQTSPQFRLGHTCLNFFWGGAGAGAGRPPQHECGMYFGTFSMAAVEAGAWRDRESGVHDTSQLTHHHSHPPHRCITYGVRCRQGAR